VRITAPELRGTRTALTGADGRYEFPDLPAGRYSIAALKAAYVDWSYGQTEPAGPGKPLVLGDRQTADGVDVGLPRGGVVTGRILDDFGDPVPNALVNLARQQFVQGQRRLVPAGGGAQTNDIGEYRLFGLTPGDYYISATLQRVPSGPTGPFGSTLEGAEARSGYAPTFFPGTTEPAAAQKITVRLSQTTSEINFALLSTRLASISGTAVDSEGRPLASGVVSLTRRGGLVGFGGGAGGGPLHSDGTFTIANVAPGEYVLRVNVNGPRRPQTGTPQAPPEFSVATVTVTGEDVSGVRLAPIATVAVSGRVSFEDPVAGQAVKPSTIRVVSQAVASGDGAPGLGNPVGLPPAVQDDLTFEMKLAPGRVALRANVPAAQGATSSGWQVKAVRVNGTDVTDEGIDVGAQGVRGVEIVLTNRSQQISGTVADGRGGAVKDYVVVVFALEAARRIAPFNRYFALGRPGDDGRFTIGSLPEGRYFGIALDRTGSLQLQDPDVLESLSRQATPFSLGAGDTSTLDLRLFTLQ
jgi:hypothetical protein